MHAHIHTLSRRIANCSHWVQQDAPEEVNQFTITMSLKRWYFKKENALSYQACTSVHVQGLEW